MLHFIAAMTANAGLLLSITLVYDLLGFREDGRSSIGRQILTGLIIGLVGIAIIGTGYQLADGIIFDLRSALLGLCALFFGFIPTAVGVLVMAIFRIVIGGTGVAVGIGIMVLAAAVGLVFRYRIGRRLEEVTVTQLFLLGVAVHVGAAGCLLLVPSEVLDELLKKVSAPGLLLFPTMTVLGGWILHFGHLRRMGEERDRALKTSRERFQDLVQNSLDLMCTHDHLGRLLWVNAAVERKLGRPSKYLLGRSLLDFMDPAFAGELEEYLREIFSKGRARGFMKICLPGGAEQVWEYRNVLRQTEDESPVVLGYATDVTEQFQARKALQKSEAWYRSIFESAADGIFVIDHSGVVADLNPSACGMLGYEFDEVVGLAIEKIDPSLVDRERRRELLRRAKLEPYVQQEARWVRKDGSIRDIEYRLSVVGEGASGVLFGIARDVTERRAREEEIREYRDRFQKVFETIPDPVSLSRFQDGVFREVNRAFCEVTGYSKDDILGQSVEELDFWEAPKDRDRLLRLLRAEGRVRNLEFSFRNRDGIAYPVLLSATTVSIGEEECILAVFKDLREWLARREQLRIAKARLELLRELDLAILEAGSIDEIITSTLIRLEGLIGSDLYSMMLFERGSGKARVYFPPHLSGGPGAMEEIPLEDLGPALEKMDSGEVMSLRDFADAEDPWIGLVRLRNRGFQSGFWIPIESNGKLEGSLNFVFRRREGYSEVEVEIGREAAAALALALEQNSLRKELQDYAAGLEIRVRERTAELEAGKLEAENLNRAMMSLMDDLKLEVRRSERLTERLKISNEELESFAYSVSHDLRAPLRHIEGFAAILEDDLRGVLDGEQRDTFRRMKDAARRMNEMISAVLEISRLERGEFQPARVDLSAMAARVVQELRASDPDRELVLEIEENLEVEADPVLLRLMLENLLGNAWKFSSKEEKTHIEVRRIEPRPEGTPVFLVRDNGVGFDMRYRDRLFGIFGRLHRKGEFEGFGVGLATVYRIVRRHGGKIWAESEPGRGASFFFTLAPEPGEEES